MLGVQHVNILLHMKQYVQQAHHPAWAQFLLTFCLYEIVCPVDAANTKDAVIALIDILLHMKQYVRC